MLEFGFLTWMIGILSFIIFATAKYFINGLMIGWMALIFLAMTIVSFIPILNVMVWVTLIPSTFLMIYVTYKKLIEGGKIAAFFGKRYEPTTPIFTPDPWGRSRY